MRKKPELITYRNFVESVYHIVFIGNTTRALSRSMVSVGKKITKEEKSVYRVLIQSKTLIDVVSLVDELNNYLFSYNPESESVRGKIEAYRYIIQPVLDHMNSWSDIRMFRNNVLAHNYRIDKNGFESVHLTNKLFDYNVPRSSIDLGILFELIDVVTKVAEDIFDEEYQLALKIVDEFEEPAKLIRQDLKKETEKVNRILEEVNIRIDKYIKS